MTARTLRDYRLDAGLTLKQLADAAGVSETTVTLAEEGRRVPHPPNRKKIADALAAALGVPVPVTSVVEFADGDRERTRRRGKRT